MKFVVTALVQVPVKACVEVEAVSEEDAMRKAPFAFRPSDHIVPGTEDYGAAHHFDPLSASQDKH